MKAPLRPRALRFQSLESRNLLAGNVLVESRNNQLFVTGDTQDNGLTIERIFDPASGAASFLLVTPDATTSINNQPVGQAVSIADFNRDGRVDLLAGSDRLTLVGHSFDDSFPNTALRVSTGSGADHIQIESWSWGAGIVVAGDWNNDGVDTVGISRVRAGIAGTSPVTAAALTLTDVSATVEDSDFVGVVSAVHKVFAKVEIHRTTASSLSLSEVEGTVTDSDFTGAMSAKGKVFAKVEIDRCSASSLTLTNTDATVTESDFTGAIKYACTGKHIGNVVLELCTASSVSVVQRGGGVHFSSERSSFTSAFFDLAPATGASASTSPLLQSSFTSIDDDCDGIMSVSSVGQMDVTVDGSSASDFYVKMRPEILRPQATNSKVSLSDLSVTKRISIVGRGGLDVTADACRAVDFLLQLEDIKGERHRSSLSLTQCECTHLSVRSTGNLDVDMSSSEFFDVVADISPLNGLPPGEPIMKWKMNEVLVSSFCTVSTRAGDVDAQISNSHFDIASFSFGASNAGSTAAGSGLSGGKVSFQDLHFTRSASLSVTGLYDVDVSSFAATDFHLKLDRVSNPLNFSSVSYSKVELTGRMSIESNGALDVSLDSSSAVDAFVKLGSVKGELHRAALALTSTTITTRLSLISLVTCDVSLTENSRFHDVFVDVTRSASPPGQPYLQIKMEDILVTGFASVSTKGGPVDADISNSSFEVCSFSFGASNPSTIGGSGGGAGKIKFNEFTIKKSASLSLSGRYDVDVSSFSAVDFSIKIDGASPSSLVKEIEYLRVKHAALSGRLSIEAIGALDTTLESCSARDMFMKLGDIKGELLRSSVSIVGSSASSRLSLTSLVTCDVELSENSVFHDVSIDVTRSASAPGEPYMQIKMVDILVTGFSSVSTKGGPVDAEIGDSTFEGACSWSFGASNPSTVGSGGGGGAGKVNVHDISVTKSVSMSASGLYDVVVSSFSAVDFFLKMQRTAATQKVSTADFNDLELSGAMSLHSTGAITSTYALCYTTNNTVWVESIKGETLRSSVSMDDSASSSRLSITSTSTCDVSLTSSSFHDVAVSVTRSSAPPAQPYMKIELENILVTGYCTVGGQGGADADVSDSTFEKSLSFSWGLSQTGTFGTGGGGGAGKVSMSDLSIVGPLSITSRGQTEISALASTFSSLYMKVDRVSRLDDNSVVDLEACSSGDLTLLSRGGLDLSIQGGTFSKVFAKHDSIPGESHRQSVAIDGISASSLSITSTEAQDFTFTNSQVAVDVFLDFSASSTSPPGAASALTSSLSDLTIRGDLTFSSRGASQDVKLTRVSSDDAFLVLDAGSGRSAKVIAQDSWHTNSLSVITRGESDVTLDGCSARDMFLKFDRLLTGQPGTSSLAMSDCPVDGTVSVQSAGSLDVEVEASRMTDFLLKIDPIRGERRTSSISLSSLSVSSLMSVASSGGVAITYTGCRASDWFIRLDRPTGASTVDGSRILVEDGDCDDSFALSSSSGADLITFNDLTVHGRTTVSLGAGDDRLDMVSCAFEDALFNGGQGFDRLTVTDSVFSFPFQKIEFEI